MRIGRAGNKVYIQASYNPIFGVDGKVFKVVKFATDVTGRVENVQALGNGLQMLSSGNLCADLPKSFIPALEQLRVDFNNTSGKLRTTMKAVRQNAQAIAAGSSEMKTAADDLAKRTEQQAASVEETAAALEEITQTVSDSSRRADEAGRLVVSARIPCWKPRDRHHKITSGIADETLDIPLVVAFAGTAVAIPDQVVGQEAAEQRRPLAGAIRQDLRDQATVVVIDDRLRPGPEEGECMDVAVDPGLGHRRRIGPHVAAVAMRQIEHEETGLLFHAANHHRRLTEVGLRMAGRMRQRHEHLLPTLIPLAV